MLNNPNLIVTKQDDYFGSYNQPYVVKWLDLVQWFSQPYICDDKNAAPMFAACNSLKFYEKKWQNALEYYAVVLDYDDGTTITEFKIKYSAYEYFIYTSHSHLKDGKTQKFRVILPLAKPIPRDELAGRKKALFGIFPTTDVSTFARFRHFSIPSCPEDRKHLFHCHHNKGQLLDVHPLKFIPLPKAPNKAELLKRSQTRKTQSVDPVKQAHLKAKFLDDARKVISTEHGYNDMRTLAIKLAKIGLSLPEIESAISSIPHPDKYSPVERSLAGYDWWEQNDGELATYVLSCADRTIIKFANTRQRRGY
ncbi:hypothetical protein QO230_00620 [Vibrio vulnificus]|uniref:hypothetical protein n=1 Tax=Vibrio vulnificus TaxID=672 RepID=UPI0024DF8DA3|nr:hypothetical protein [Vibrio vulnificus]MDK2606118.1 hypothetical protein [Vibrio vulnificus]MDK2609862.1 hypothetical protein [Vibrio vulnificus]MDK2627360.1 hypothetical protein [Vibrio vulnificus]MDK2702805.1 hypothetical protein [Vibrio vulnificus]